MYIIQQKNAYGEVIFERHCATMDQLREATLVCLDCLADGDSFCYGVTEEEVND